MHTKKYTLYLIALGLGIILLIACAAIIDRVSRPVNTSAVTTTPSKPARTIPDIKTGNRIGNMAPDFTLKTADDRDIKLSDYRGKNIILNFWATWCGPCRMEMSALQSIHEKWGKADVVLLAVNTQDGFDESRSYAKTNGLTFTIPVDIPGKVAELYGVRGLPTSYFINSDGVIASIKIGPFINTDEIEERMVKFK
jgi:peroxiredoxin